MFCRYPPAIFFASPQKSAKCEIKRVHNQLEGTKMKRVQPLKVGIIGVGNQGREHLSAIEHLVADRQLDLVGICDLNAQMAKAHAERLQTEWYTNSTQLVSELKPDLVVLSVQIFVCLPFVSADPYRTVATSV
jgi:hypothetical protein